MTFLLGSTTSSGKWRWPLAGALFGLATGLSTVSDFGDGYVQLAKPIGTPLMVILGMWVSIVIAIRVAFEVERPSSQILILMRSYSSESESHRTMQSP
jgi:hypothetical protein